jgi:protein-disulfide isomerase
MLSPKICSTPVLRATRSSLLYLVTIVIACACTARQTCAQTQDKIVAVVNDTAITEAEVDQMVLSQILPLEQQLFAIRQAALENLIVRHLLEEEAKRKGVSVEDLRRQMTSGKVEVPPQKVDEIYGQNASVFATMSPDEAKERVRLDLENQERMQNYLAALQLLRKNARIEIRLGEPRVPYADIAGPSIGPEQAPVTLIEFSDFQCMFCRNSQPVIKQLLQHYGSSIRLIFKHLPLEIHSEAFGAATAAVCADQQGLFWKYHDALFNTDDLTSNALQKLSAKLGLAESNFKTCLESENSRNAVVADLAEARRLGLNSTPSFVINGRLVRGAHTLEEFLAIIDHELQTVKKIPRDH